MKGTDSQEASPQEASKGLGKKGKKGKKVRPRRWWRWPMRILMGLLLLAVILRVAIHVAIPYVAEAICESIGLRVEFKAIRLSLLSLRVELEDVALYASNAAASDPPLLRLDKGDVQFDLGALLDDGSIRFPWAELDGVELEFGLEDDRMVTLWDRIAEYGQEQALAEGSEASDDPVNEENADASPQSEQVDRVDLTLPVELGSVRIQHLVIAFEDRRQGMELKAKLLCNLVGKNLGSRIERNRLTLSASSPNVIEALRLDLDGIAGPGILNASIGLHVAEVEPLSMEKHLKQLGIFPKGRDVALELQATVDIKPRSSEERGAKGIFRVEKLDLFMDSERTFQLGRLDADVIAWEPRLFHVGKLELDGFRSQVGVIDGGQLSIAGLALLGSAASNGGGAEDQRPGDPALAASDAVATRIDEVRLTDLQVAFRDEGMNLTQDFKLSSGTISNLALGGSGPPPAIKLQADMALPGSLETWQVAGSFEPKGAVRHLSLDSRMNGLTLGKLTPYLVAAGFQPELVQGELSFAVRGDVEKQANGGLGIDLGLENLKLSDGKDLLVLDRLDMQGFAQGVEPGLQSIQKIELAGLGLEVERDEEDRIHLLGMRVLDGTAGANGSEAKTGESESGTKKPLVAEGKREPGGSAGRMALDLLVARESWIHLRDRSKRARLKDIHGAWSGDIKHLRLGQWDAAVPPMEFDLRVSARDILDRLDIKGQMEKKGQGQDLAVDLSGTGVHGQNLKPFLDSLGLSPEFEQAALSLRLEVDGLAGASPFPSEVRVRSLRWSEGEKSLFEVSSLDVRGLTKTPGGMEIDTIEIQGPALGVLRDEEGMLHLAGVRLQPVAANAGAKPAVATKPVAGEGGASGQAVVQVPEAGPSFSLKSLKLGGGKLNIDDRFQREKPAIPVDLSLELKDLSLEPGGPSVSWDLAVSVRDNLEELRLRGDLSRKQGLALELDVAAKGIRGGILSDYLPEGIGFDMGKGQLLGRAQVHLESGSKGPRALRAELNGWRLTDEGKALWQLDKLVFHASRVDTGRKSYKIKEFTTKGHEVSLTRDVEKKLRAFGLVFEAPSELEAVAEDPQPTKADQQKKAVARVDRIESLRRPLEMLAPVHLGVVAFGLDRIRFHDQSVPGSVPVDGHLRILNLAPIDLIPEDFDEMPTEKIKIEASLLPIVRKLELDITARVWNVMPEVELSVRAEGIRGEGLTEVFPDLAKRIHGRELTDGTFKAHMDLSLRLRRSSRMEFPFENGFGMSFDLEDVEFRDKPEGRVLAGLDQLEIQLRTHEARTGQTWIRAINIETPTARIDRTEDGTVIGGICFLQPKKQPVSNEKAAEVETVPSANIQEQGPAKDAPGDKTEPHAPSLRIASGTISGLDFVYRDLRTSPPTILPITGLEAELKNFSRGLADVRRPMTFEVYIDGGMIDLPKRPESKGLIGGLVSTASGVVVSSKKGGVTMEKRPVFDELSLKGALFTTPKLKGQVKLDLGALELLTFKHIAKRNGVIIQDGVLDLSTTAQMGGDEQVQVSLYPVFTFLSLSEPKGGFLSSLLALPAPLDTTLFLTENSRGEHVYPISFTLKRGEISPGQIRSIVIGALSRSLATMVTNSPFRILGGVTSIVGFDLNTRNTQVGDPIKLEFGPGQVVLTEKQKGKLAAVVAALKDDSGLDVRIVQRSGTDDWAYASRIANPSREECRAMARGILQRRRELSRRRSTLAKRILSLYANGRAQEAEKWGADLRQLDRGLGQLQLSMDEIVSHLRPGAERQKGRRTKVANHEIAVHRIENVKAQLIQLGGKGISSRIETIRPRSRKDETLKVGQVLLVQRRRVGR